MTWVKICGTTNLEDALVAVEAGADAVGFVFYEKSPRCVSVEAVREIVAKLPESVEKVGVFVGDSADRVEALASYAGLTAIQFYNAGKESASASWMSIRQDQGRKLIVALSNQELSEGGIFRDEDAKSRIHAVLIDSGSGERRGGTGRPFDWKNLRGEVHGLNRLLPVIVAGGLNSESVGDAIEILQPWGVDVASGVEASPGKKDPDKVRAFVQAVRKIDRKTA